jgi:hypothetical protein
MKYLFTLLLFAACRDEAAEERRFLEGKREAFILVNDVVNDLLKESNAKWDTLARVESIKMSMLNGRLDALNQISFLLRDSVAKYQSINQ